MSSASHDDVVPGALTDGGPPLWQVALVSFYLLAIYCWLRLTRALPSSGMRSFMTAFLRRKDRKALAPEAIAHQSGHSYVIEINTQLSSDADGVSPYSLHENGQPLPFGHALHDDIRSKGAGRYSHWQKWLVFSTSDN